MKYYFNFVPSLIHTYIHIQGNSYSTLLLIKNSHDLKKSTYSKNVDLLIEDIFLKSKCQIINNDRKFNISESDFKYIYTFSHNLNR